MIEWYVRQRGQLRGPFNSGEVRRLLLQEELTLEDEVSRDGIDWQPIGAVAEVLPRQLRGTDAADEQELIDEGHGQRRQALVSLLTLLLLVGGVIVVALWLDTPEQPQADCAAPPAPAVDWQDCRFVMLHAPKADLRGAVITNGALPDANLHGSDLSGADLRYADLKGADLSYARLNGAQLKGADLRGADLTYADLRNADLSFVDLRGARVGGADLLGAGLHGALWIDGRRCAEGPTCSVREGP
jgi:hypothetical protein